MVKAVGKSKAMEICLTGSVNLNAEEAERLGLVSKIVAADQLVDEAVKTAEKIASMSQPMVQMIKESINQCECVGDVARVILPYWCKSTNSNGDLSIRAVSSIWTALRTSSFSKHFWHCKWKANSVHAIWMNGI